MPHHQNHCCFFTPLRAYTGGYIVSNIMLTTLLCLYPGQAKLATLTSILLELCLAESSDVGVQHLSWNSQNPADDKNQLIVLYAAMRYISGGLQFSPGINETFAYGILMLIRTMFAISLPLAFEYREREQRRELQV